jgi:hypothetical protein
VSWVRLSVGDGLARAEAVGVGYRLPASRPIPLRLASDLIASGTPWVWRQVDDAERRASEEDGRPTPRTVPG